jgi:hypothetical protein
MRRSLLAVAVVTGLLTLPMLHEAAAVPVMIAPPTAPDGSIKEVYYYHGRYYPYHYRGQYFRHRYYRYGRWHYY